MISYKNKRRLVKAYRLVTAVEVLMAAVGDFVIDLVFYRGRPGSIDFMVEGQEADGTVLLREFGDRRNVTIPFRVANRRYGNRAEATKLFIMAIQSQCLEQGYRLVRVTWGKCIGEMQAAPPVDKFETEWVVPSKHLYQLSGEELAIYQKRIHEPVPKSQRASAPMPVRPLRSVVSVR